MNQLSIEPWLEAISMRPRTAFAARLAARGVPRGRWDGPAQPLSYNAL